MGITIHYRLRSASRGPQEVRELITRLRERAGDLPFERVHEIIELTGQDCDFQQHDDEYAYRWLLIQTRQLVPDPHETARSYAVIPAHVIAFCCEPGPGCEPANFGLCRYPATIEVGPWMQRTLPTNLHQWHWASFCKTEYAGRSRYGGPGNFQRCHWAIVDLLQHAQSLGILHEVHDEAGYWDSRQVFAEVLGMACV